MKFNLQQITQDVAFINGWVWWHKSRHHWSINFLIVSWNTYINAQIFLSRFSTWCWIQIIRMYPCNIINHRCWPIILLPLDCHFLEFFLDIWWRYGPYGNHLIEQWCVGKDSLVEYYFGIVFEFVANNRINDPWLDDHQYFASHWMAIVLGVIPVFSTLDDHFDHKRFLFWSLKMVWFSTKSEGSIFYLPFGLLINDGGLATKLSIVKLVLVIFRIVF